MSQPWEDYSGETATETPPWEDFSGGVPAADKTSKLPVKEGFFGNEQPNARAIGTLEAPIAAVGGATSGVLNYIASLFGKGGGRPILGGTGETRDPFAYGKPMINAEFANEDIDPVNKVLGTTLRSFSTPESAVTLGGGALLKSARLPALLFGGPMLEQAPASTAEAARAVGEVSGTPQPTDEQKFRAQEAVLNDIVQKIMLGGIAHGLFEGKTEGGKGQTETASPPWEDYKQPIDVESTVEKPMPEAVPPVEEPKVAPVAETPLNPGGSEANLPPEKKATSKENNSIAAFAKANGVEYVEGDTGASIMAKVQAKAKPVEPTPEVKADIEAGVPVDSDANNLRHELKNVAQIAAAVPKESRQGFLDSGDKIYQKYFESGDINAAMEEAKQLKRSIEANKTTGKPVEPEAAAPVEKPAWVTNLEAISKKNRNEMMNQRLEKWYDKNPSQKPVEAPAQNATEAWNNWRAYRDAVFQDLGVRHGTDVHTVLSKIASKSELGDDANLANFLLRHYAEPLKNSKFDLEDTGASKNPHYMPSDRTIYNVTKGNHDPASVILHEAAHAATWWAYERPRGRQQLLAKMALDNLLHEAKKETSVSKSFDETQKALFDYNLSTTQEFIAGIFSNEHLRAHLNEIKIGATSLWGKVKDAIKSLLGIKPQTALDLAFDTLIEGKKGLGIEAQEGGTKGASRATTSTESPGNIRAAGKDTNAPDRSISRPGERQEAPPSSDPLPFRYKDYADEKKDSTTPQGLGKVPILRRIFDPRSYKTGPEEQVLLTNQISKQKAKTGVATWLEKNKGKNPFKVGDDGKAVLQGGAKGFMSDVIEAELRNPGSQPLTSEQRAFVDMWREMNAEGVRYAQANGVKTFLDADGNPRPIDASYFPRPRTGDASGSTRMRVGAGSRPGAKQSSFKARFHETEAEGFNAGARYEGDAYNRAAEWLKSVYNAVADARLAKDPNLKGRLGIRLVPSGIYAPKGGPMTLMRVGKGPKFGEGQVFGVPALEGRIFPKETADKLAEFYQHSPPKALRVASYINDAIKAAKFTFDVSAPFNQGLPLLSYSPSAWGKATFESYKAMADGLVNGDPKTLSKYLNVPENSKAAREFVENGGSIVRLEDFLHGAERGGLIEKVPGVRRIVNASGKSMGTFLSIAKLELYKSLKPLADAKGWDKAQLVESVENTIMSGRMEQIGLTHGRALMERLAFNAPSYLRAFGNLAVEAAKGTVKGVAGKDVTVSEHVARRAVVGMLTAVTLQAFAAYKLMGLSDDEIKERMNPMSSNFLRVQVPVGEGKNVELSYGNVFFSAVRLLGETANIVTGKKELGSGVEHNPFLRWLSFRKSPVIDFFWQWGTGRDFRGQPISGLEAAGRSIVPIPIEPGMDAAIGNQTKKSAAVEAGASFLGLNSYTKEQASMKERARKTFNKELSNLTLSERLTLAQQKSKEPKPSIREQEAVSKAATEREFERRRSVANSLPPEQRSFLTENKLQLPAFQTGFEIRNLQVPLTDDERKQQVEFIKEEFKTSIDRLMKSPRIEEFKKDGSLQRRLNVILSDSAERARIRTKRQVKR